MPTTYTNPLSLTSQFPFCGLPLRLDSYRGCAFRCTYCFARNRGGNSPEENIRPADPSAVIRRIHRALSGGGAGVLAQFLRRRVPIHFGGMSDPLQPIEQRLRVTERILRGLLRSHYPTVLSTRGALVMESPYWELLRDLGAVVQFSFSSTHDPVAVGVEPHATPPSKLMRAMEFLSRNGIAVTSRWQPYIPTISEPPEDFVPRIAATGCRHIALEHLKVPVERRDKVWSAFPILGGHDLNAYYRDRGAIRDGREFILPGSTKLPITLRVRAAAHKHHMSFGAADNELQHLSDTSCCCSGVDRFPGFENFFRHQIGYALHKARGADAIRYSSIAEEWAPQGSIDRFLNSRSRLSGRKAQAGSLTEHIRARWNEPAAHDSPAGFFGVASSGVADASGDIIYQWNSGTIEYLKTI